MHQNKLQFDVIILGSGLVGSILATVLAKHNARVLVVDRSSHPRFAIGEALTPDTDLMLKILGHQYSVPELLHLSSFESICEHISPSACGYKRSFNFIYHSKGKMPIPQETNKIGVHHSSHLYRQDIDQYMAEVAVKYGVELFENTKVTDLKIDSEGVSIELNSDQRVTGNYLVDASGYNSLVSHTFKLRENPTRFKTQSRSLFTHMVDVKRYDDCAQFEETDQNSLPWHQGTLHHLFEGGWIWVIPFNNHAKSANPICSVGLNLDLRYFPTTDLEPEQEFKAFLSRYPGIATQFENARSVRPWVSTGRLQYSSHSCTGKRFYVLPHASGFVDALYSFGLVSSYTVLIPLAARILKAISENDYSSEHFSDLECLQQALFDYNDNLVNCAYISFRNHNLWNAWRRVWLLGTFIRQIKAGVRKGLKIEAGKGKTLVGWDDDSDLDYLTPSFAELGETFFQNARAIIEAVEVGSVSSDSAADQIISLISSVDFLPKNYFDLGNAAQKDLDVVSNFGIAEQARLFRWIKSSQKPEVKKYFDYDIEDLLAVAKLSASR